MSEQIEQAESGKDLAPVEVGEKIETESTKGHHMDEGPGILTVELPCGYIDGDGKLHDTLTVGEMTGYEEDILAGKGPIVPRLNQIVGNCTRRFGDLTDKNEIHHAVTNMMASDRLCALIAIRRVSLGDYYDVKIECPSPDCREHSRFSLNLADIDIIRMKDQTARVREDELSSGKTVSWHIMSAADDEWLSKRTKKKEDVLTLAMMARVDAVDVNVSGSLTLTKVEREGKKYKEGLALLKSLSIKDRNEIRRLFEIHEGSVDTEVDFQCPACNYEWKADMDVGQAGFFFPSDM